MLDVQCFNNYLNTVKSVRIMLVTTQFVYMCAVANGVYQNSIYGVAAYMPMNYTNAVVTGTVRVIN